VSGMHMPGPCPVCTDPHEAHVHPDTIAVFRLEAERDRLRSVVLSVASMPCDPIAAALVEGRGA